MQCTQIPAILKPQLCEIGLIVLLSQSELILQIADLTLQVQANFFHTGFQGADFFLLGFYDFALLEALECAYHSGWR